MRISFVTNYFPGSKCKKVSAAVPLFAFLNPLIGMATTENRFHINTYQVQSSE